MSIHIVINGKEVESPLARFLVGLLAIIVLMLFGVVFIVVILPLTGVTLVLSFGIFVVIMLAVFISLFVVLAVYQYQDKKQKRIEKK